MELSIVQVLIRLGLIGAYFIIAVLMFTNLVGMHADSKEKNGIVVGFPLTIFDGSQFTVEGLRCRTSFFRLWIVATALGVLSWWVMDVA